MVGRKHNRRSRFLFAVAVLSAGIVGGGFLMQRGLLAAPRRAPSALFREVLELVRRDYVDTLADSALYVRSASGVIAELHDPASTFLTRDRLAELDETASGRYVGIGVEVDNRQGFMTIVSVLPESPAALAGIRPGDRLISIDGKTVLGLAADDVLDELRGTAGSAVRLTMSRPGADSSMSRTLTRRQIHVQSVQRVAVLQDGIGYLAANAFSQQTASELTRSIDSLMRAPLHGLIIDLRGNPGGLLEQGVAVADLFLKAGQVAVAMRGRAAGSSRTFANNSPSRWPALPLAVLVDSNTASAAEIVAGAWQDHDRAVIIGSPTYGKGSAQQIFSLPASAGRDAVKLTVARWFTPSGRSIDKPHPDAAEIDSSGVAPSRAFRTDAGRAIRGGGGIQPDVAVAALPGVVPSLDKDPVVATAVRLLAGARNQQDVLTRASAKGLDRRP